MYTLKTVDDWLTNKACIDYQILPIGCGGSGCQLWNSPVMNSFGRTTDLEFIEASNPPQNHTTESD